MCYSTGRKHMLSTLGVSGPQQELNRHHLLIVTSIVFMVGQDGSCTVASYANCAEPISQSSGDWRLNVTLPAGVTVGRASKENVTWHIALGKYKTDEQHPCRPFLLKKRSSGHPGERGGSI